MTTSQTNQMSSFEMQKILQAQQLEYRDDREFNLNSESISQILNSEIVKVLTTSELSSTQEDEFNQQAQFLPLSTDNRELPQAPALFICLPSTTRSAFELCQGAIKNGYSHLIAEYSESLESELAAYLNQLNLGSSDEASASGFNPRKISVFFVKDVVKAYQQLSKARRDFSGYEPHTIAITGSSGKTTVKQILNNIFKLHYELQESGDREVPFSEVAHRILWDEDDFQEDYDEDEFDEYDEDDDLYDEDDEYDEDDDYEEEEYDEDAELDQDEYSDDDYKQSKNLDTNDISPANQSTSTDSQQPQAILATQGNFNNHIGVPHTLQHLHKGTKVAIIEHGASAVGEINELTQLTSPHIALINNVQPAHTVGFGSLQGVAQAKTEIFSNLAKDGIRLINLDSYVTEEMFDAPDEQKIFTFGEFNSPSKISAGTIYSTDPAKEPREINNKELEVTKDFVYKITEARSRGIDFDLYFPQDKLKELSFDAPYQIRITSNLLGAHQASNLTAAIAIAYLSEVPLSTIMKAVKEIDNLDGRFKIATSTNGKMTYIDDSYNANPGSVLASIRAIDKSFPYTKNKWLILGEFKELNDEDILDFFRDLEYQSMSDYNLLSLYKFIDFFIPDDCDDELAELEELKDEIKDEIKDGLRIIGKLDDHTCLGVYEYSVERLGKLIEERFASGEFDDILRNSNVALFKGSNSSKVGELIPVFLEAYYQRMKRWKMTQERFQFKS